jgi:hypothetical protein
MAGLDPAIHLFKTMGLRYGFAARIKPPVCVPTVMMFRPSGF